MIKIRGFSNYKFCPRKLQVFRFKNGNYEPLPISEKIKKDSCVILHENGNPYTVRLIDIIVDNYEEILRILGKTGNREIGH